MLKGLTRHMTEDVKRAAKQALRKNGNREDIVNREDTITAGAADFQPRHISLATPRT